MKLRKLLAQTDGISLNAPHPGAGDIEISAITFDSRQVKPGTLFVALRGATSDGHDFIAAAQVAGAAAILIDRGRAAEFEKTLSAVLLLAEDTRAALGPLSAAFFGYPADELFVAGVTGTNGKTTITWILDALFSAEDRAASGLLGTIEYRWGAHREVAMNTTPESMVIQRVLAEMRRDGVQRVAMEVSSHGLANHRLGGTHFDAAIFSNFTQDHLDFHGDMDAYREAKGRLFSALLPASRRAGKDPVAIINIDDPAGDWFTEQARGAQVETVTFGQNEAADWRATEVEQTLHGTRFWVRAPGESFAIRSKLMGEFNVSNMLAAIVAARRAGISQAQIQATLAELDAVPGRMQRVQASAPDAHGAQPAVFVDYAHTPDALGRALETVRPLTEGRVIVVFGCGGDRDRQKRAPMGEVAVKGADIAMITTDNPRTESPEAIIAEILRGTDAAKERIRVEVSRARAIEEAIGLAGANDVVLIAGKGHENYQEQNGQRVPFDDVIVARAALDAMASVGDAPKRIASWSLAKIAAAIGGQLYVDHCDVALEDAQNLRPIGVSSDTRSLKRDELFVALRGDNFDAHDFLTRADQAGALAIMVERVDGPEALGTKLPLIVVDDTLAGMSRLGHAIWSEARDAGLRTINVTGSNGKTTVKEMLALLWGARAQVFATPGNLNNHIGVPLVLCAIPAGCQRLVVEMGANGPGEIAQLLALAPGGARVVTSIGLAHLEGFGSLDGIRRAKAEIFADPSAETCAILPFSEAPNLLAPGFPGKVLTVGFEDGADIHVELLDESEHPDKPDKDAALNFQIRYADQIHTLHLPIPGKHHALNAATAIATLIADGAVIDEDALNAALAKLALPAGRWRIVEKGEYLFIDDAYNANPSSTMASVQAFVSEVGAPSAQDGRRRIVVLGEMRELGADSQVLHRQVAVDVGGLSRVDALICVGAHAAQMAEAAANATPDERALEVQAFEDAQAVVPWLRDYVSRHGPVRILLKASRGARLERLIDLVDAKSEK